MAIRGRSGLVPTPPNRSGARTRRHPLVAIVDDDESIRDTTEDLLESAGFLAVTFSSSAELLRSRRLARVGCLIADMRMPGMTGLDLSKHLATHRRPIPTILMTAWPTERTRARAVAANVVCYLNKPFHPEELLSCVRLALRRTNAL